MGTAVAATYGRAHRGVPPITDGLLALLVMAVALVSFLHRLFQVRATAPGGFRFTTVDRLGVALLLVGSLSLMWRRRAPLVVLTLSGAAFVVFDALAPAPSPLPFVPLIALYTVATARRPLVSGAAAGVLAAGALAAEVVRGSLTDDFVDFFFLVVAALMLGYGVRLNRARTALLEDQAKQLAREQASNTRLAVEREHARIARELHDIVAHNVVVIVAQAGAAKRVFPVDHEQARRALDSIETIGREALTEMRRLVGVLASDEYGLGREPQPGLKQLRGLVEQIERAGLPVEMVVTGTPRPLPAGVELNAYRIVQEALTNALKHAGPARASVELAYEAEFLRLQVSDTGRGSVPDPEPGHGLFGMRQRVALLGGELTAGPGPRGGFRVTAKLPVKGGPL